MSKRIGLIFDVGKRLLVGVHPEDPGFIVVTVLENESIVITYEGSFTWMCVPTAEAPKAESSPDKVDEVRNG